MSLSSSLLSNLSKSQMPLGLLRRTLPLTAWKPVLRHNPLMTLKLSDAENKRMKDQYFLNVTKDVLPVEKEKKGSYHIISALPAAGKSTVMKALKKNDPNLIPLERDDLVMLHPHVKKAMQVDPAKWAHHLRKIEGLDDYGNGPMLDRFMQEHYNIAQGVVSDVNSQLDKAQKNNYNADIHLVLVPERTVKMRAMQRFLTSSPESGSKRLTFSNQYDDPKTGYQARQKRHIKDVFDKHPNKPISVLFETADSEKKYEKIITSYKEYENILEYINRLPESKETRQKFNADTRHLRQMFLRQYPEVTKQMPQSHRRGALGLLQEIPE